MHTGGLDHGAGLLSMVSDMSHAQSMCKNSKCRKYVLPSSLPFTLAYFFFFFFKFYKFKFMYLSVSGALTFGIFAVVLSGSVYLIPRSCNGARWFRAWVGFLFL